MTVVDDPHAGAAASLRVACLCADWCHVCSGWRDEFEATLRQAGVPARWIDIEDEEELLGPIEVDDFPTLLVVRDGQPVWFGVIAPRAEALRRRLDAARATPALQDAALRRLAGLL
ncbi:MAG TPA: thioredoxin [Burkholderiaceae bacterium]|nr:thioredoxin [Burkholderiaceae bacterium]